jgi:hypothetical protein
MSLSGYDDNDFPRLPVQQRRTGPLPYSQGKRAFYGLMWAVWTFLLFIGGISAAVSGAVGTGLLLLSLSVLAGIYDLRIWTWQAKHLWFLIIW